MKIKEILKEIIDKNNKEDMYKLNDMLSELIYDLKTEHPEKYKKYKTELYEIAYGKVITKEKAKEIVEEMKPFGEHYSIEMINNMFNGYLGNHNEIDYYLVANSLYNDYHDVIGDDDEMYKELTDKWLNDEDAVEDKAYYYFMNIPKRG